MPHRDFAAARSRALSEAITFTFAGERFTCNERPSLGDTFNLMDVPDPTPQTLAQCAYQLAQFISRMLVPEDRPRWEQVLHTIPQDQVADVIELGVWLSEEVTGRPFAQAVSYSGGRRRTGTNSKRATGGKRASRTSPRS